MINVTMTCRVAGCGNEGIALTMPCEEVPEACICGPCDQPIEDVEYETINPEGDNE